MKKIFLNETHIQQLVKETLENLLIDNEVNHNLSSQEVVKLINNSEFKYDDDIYVKGREGAIVLVYNNQNYDDEIFLGINFYIDGYITTYYPGDYYTPSEGGELEIRKFEPTNATIYLDGEDHELNVKELYKFLKSILDNHYEDIYNKTNYEYFINEPDLDAKYDARKKWGF